MKCNLLVKYERRGKKKILKPVQWVSWDHFVRLGDIDLTGHEVCDGNVRAYVKVRDEPYYGGTIATFQVDYVCEKCGGLYYPHLPQSEEEVSKWLTRAIAEADYEVIMVPAREAAQKAMEENNNIRAKIQSRLDSRRK
ncbi:MAG: hypothetical protein HC888_03110 [Candidatus Competibacteraceae bacterium]|nr:hypothetical protein [Candidatus Competibacteraceae bacterium]